VEKAAREYTILEDGHVVFVVEVLVETQYSVLSVRNWCTGSGVWWVACVKWAGFLCMQATQINMQTVRTRDRIN